MLPASAGMILSPATVIHTAIGAPRIRGDDPGILGKIFHVNMCSPHPRG